ncbi:hypothetical protein ACJA25_02235 [Mycoplasmopsis hyopharyngis]|uniref:hypothetical protein n=1 Tax=Mycoplasmopsis hyopharyngis TaxID=29558 RepID=UPI003873C0A3
MSTTKNKKTNTSSTKRSVKPKTNDKKIIETKKEEEKVFLTDQESNFAIEENLPELTNKKDNELQVFSSTNNLPQNNSQFLSISPYGTNLPMNPAEFEKQMQEIALVNQKFKKIIFWSVSGAATAFIFFGGIAGMVSTAKSNKVDPVQNLKQLIKISIDFANDTLTDVAFEKNRIELELLIRNAENQIQNNPKNVDAIKNISNELYEKFKYISNLYINKHPHIKKINDFIESQRVKNLSESILVFDEYEDFKGEYKEEIKKLEAVKNSQNPEINATEYDQALIVFSNFIQDIENRKKNRDLKINAYYELKSLYEIANNWLQNQKNMAHEAFNKIFPTLDKVRKNFINNPAVNPKKPTDKTEIKDINISLKDLSQAFYSAKKIHYHRLDIEAFIENLQEQVNDFHIEFTTIDDNIFKKEYDKFKIISQGNEEKTINAYIENLIIEKNTLTSLNVDLQQKAINLNNTLVELIKKCNLIRIEINNKAKDIENIKTEIQSWIINPSYYESEDLKINEIVDLDILNALGDDSKGLIYKIDSTIFEINRYKLNADQINEEKEKISKELEEIKQTKIAKSAALKDIQEKIKNFESTYNNKYLSWDVNNIPTDKSKIKLLIYEKLNENYSNFIQSYSSKLSSPYSLNEVRKIKEKINTYLNEYRAELEKIDKDLESFKKNTQGIKLVDPSKPTNNPKPILAENEYNKFIPSQITDYVLEQQLILQSDYLKNNFLKTEIILCPNDINGFLTLKIKLYFEKVIYDNPSQPTLENSRIIKFYYDEEEKVIQSMKKFAFSENDRISFTIASSFPESITSTDILVNHLINYQNKEIKNGDWSIPNSPNIEESKLLNIYFDEKLKNKYVLKSVSKDDKLNNNYLKIIYSIQREVPYDRDEKGNIIYKMIDPIEQSEEIDITKLIKANTENNETKRYYNRLSAIYEQTKTWITKKLDQKKDKTDLIDPLETILQDAKTNLLDKIDEISNSQDEAKKQEYIKKCKEKIIAILSKKNETQKAKSEKNIAVAELEISLQKAKTLYSSIITAPTAKADESDSNSLKAKIDDAENKIKPEVQVSLEELKTSLQQLNETFTTISASFDAKNNERKFIDIAISEIQSNNLKNFTDIQLKQEFLDLSKKLIDEITKSKNETDDTVDKIKATAKKLNDEQKKIEDGYNASFGKITELRNELNSLILFKKANLDNFKYLKYYKDEYEKLINKTQETTGEGITKPVKFEQIKNALEHLQTTKTTLYDKLVLFTKQRQQLLSFINTTIDSWIKGKTLTRLPDNNTTEVEGLIAQDFNDIADPFNKFVIEKKNQLELEPTSGKTIEEIYTNIKKELEDKFKEYKDYKIKKFENKNKLLDLIKTKEKFVLDWLTGITIVDVNHIKKIFNDEIKIATDLHKQVTSTNDTFEQAIKNLTDKTNIALNESTYELKSKWDLIIQKINEIVKKIEDEVKNFENVDNENWNADPKAISIVNDSELKEDTSFRAAIKNLEYTNTNNSPWSIVQNKYYALTNSYNLIKNKKLHKISQRQKFINVLKRAIYQRNQNIIDNIYPEPNSAFTKHTNKLPAIMSSFDYYKKLDLIDSDSDPFHSTKNEKVETYRKIIDKVYKHFDYDNNNSYETAIAELEQWISEAIHYKDVKMKNAISKYNELKNKVIALQNSANQNNITSDLKNQCSNYVQEMEQKYNNAIALNSFTKVENIVSQYTPLYNSSNNEYNKRIELRNKLQSDISNSRSYLNIYSEHPNLNNFKVTLTNKIDIMTKVAQGINGPIASATLDNYIKSFNNDVQSVYNNYKNEYKSKYDYVLGYKAKINSFLSGISFPRDNEILPPNYYQTMNWTNNVSSYVDALTKGIKYNTIINAMNWIDSYYGRFHSNATNRNNLLSEIRKLVSDATASLGRSFNYTYPCCRCYYTGNLWAIHGQGSAHNVHTKTNLESKINEINGKIASGASSISASSLNALKAELTNAHNVWISNSGGSEWCRSVWVSRGWGKYCCEGHNKRM